MLGFYLIGKFYYAGAWCPKPSDSPYAPGTTGRYTIIYLNNTVYDFLNVSRTGWAFGHYAFGFVQGLPKTAQNCPKLPKIIFTKYIVKIILLSIKIN